MTMPENTFIASVHKFLPDKDSLHREKNHNPYRGGTADVWYSGERDLWIEYKFIVVPKRDNTVIDLVTPRGKKMECDISLLQQEWLRRRHIEGRNVAVVVGCKEGGVIFTERRWEQPLRVDEFRQHLITRQEIADWIEVYVGKVVHGNSVPTGAVHDSQGSRRVVQNRDRRAAALLHGTPIDSTPRTIGNAKGKPRTNAAKGMGRGR